MKVFGIKSCDTCRRVIKDLQAAGQDVTFIDVRIDPLGAELIDSFHLKFGEALINRRSTTWRGLDEQTRQRSVSDLLTNHPTLMKRPVIVAGDVMTLGWDAAAKETHLGTS